MITAEEMARRITRAVSDDMALRIADRHMAVTLDRMAQRIAALTAAADNDRQSGNER